MYSVGQKFLYSCGRRVLLICWMWESRIHDNLGSIRDYKHTPMRVTCSTLYCTFTVTSALAFALFLTDTKGFWLTLYIYTQIHTHMHIAKSWPTLN